MSRRNAEKIVLGGDDKIEKVYWVMMGNRRKPEGDARFDWWILVDRVCGKANLGVIVVGADDIAERVTSQDVRGDASMFGDTYCMGCGRASIGGTKQDKTGYIAEGSCREDRSWRR